MLYAFYKSTMDFLKPIHQTAKLTLENFSPKFCLGPMCRIVMAQQALLERDTRDYGRPEFGISEVICQGEPIKISEVIVEKTPFCTLRHFKKRGSKKGPQVLLIAPLSGHYSTLLRDTIRRLLQSCDVFLTDWENAKDVPIQEGPFHLDDYIALLLRYFKTFKGPFHVIAVCQPSVPATIATILSEKMGSDFCPASLTLMGGPIDTRVNPSRINEFAQSHSLEWFRSVCLTPVPFSFKGAFRQVCPGFLMLNGFMSIDPQRHMNSHMEFYKNLVQGSGELISRHTQFYDEYRSVMDLPGEYVMDSLERVFQKHLLPQGLYPWEGEYVKPSELAKTPLLIIEGTLDEISPPGQTKAILDLTPHLPKERKHHHLAEGVGHYGIFSGHKWREEIAPLIERFIEDPFSANYNHN